SIQKARILRLDDANRLQAIISVAAGFVCLVVAVAVKDELDAVPSAEPQAVAVFQFRAAHLPVVDESAGGAAEIAQLKGCAIARDFDVMARDVGIVDFEIVAGETTDAKRRRFEFNDAPAALRVYQSQACLLRHNFPCTVPCSASC